MFCGSNFNARHSHSAMSKPKSTYDWINLLAVDDYTKIESPQIVTQKTQIFGAAPYQLFDY